MNKIGIGGFMNTRQPCFTKGTDTLSLTMLEKKNDCLYLHWGTGGTTTWNSSVNCTKVVGSRTGMGTEAVPLQELSFA